MEIYTYRVAVLTGPSGAGNGPTRLPDIRGFDVEATDGHIGKVEDATYSDASSCLIVDTGFWIFGKKRMIPAGVVRRVDPDEKRVYVNMTKDQVKGAPDYDSDRHDKDEKGYHKEVGEYYEPHAS
jgi:hypothetical protein